MSTQQRRISLVVGTVFLAVFGWSLWLSLDVLADGPVTGETVALLAAGGAILLGGLAFLVAGLRERVGIGGRTYEWWQFQSLGFVFLGSYMAISALAQASPTSFYALTALAAGLGFVVFGIQRFRTGPPVESEPSVRQVATIVVGTLVALLVLVGAMLLLT